MSAHILIVDTVAARRILLRASLASAHYHVTQTSDPAAAAALAMALLPDLVVVDLADPGPALEAVGALRRGMGADLPLIALAPPDRPHLRLAALEAGADEAMDQGTADALLHARIRSLLRDRDAAGELALREEDEAVALGAYAGGAFAEGFPRAGGGGAGPLRRIALAPEGPSPPGLAEGRAAFLGAPPPAGRVAVLPVAGPMALAGAASGGRAGAASWAASGAGTAPGADWGVPAAVAGLPEALGCAVRVLDSPADLGGHGPAPDLVVIHGASAGDPAAEAEVLRQLADLRSRSATRHAATLVVLPATAVGAAAMALDLGAGDVVSEEVGSEEVLARVRALIGRKSRADGLRDSIQSQLQAAVRDPLTGLHNRRYAEPVLARMARRAEATGTGFALMILDIDNFKSINDTFGHAAGDRVIAEVARRLRDAVRPGDLVARIGGEEFLVAIPDSAVEGARAGAERLRRAVETAPFRVERAFAPASQEGAAWGIAAAFGKGGHAGHAGLRALPAPFPGGEEISVTLSVGVAVGDGGRPVALDLLFERADGALYAAKTAGRNTVAMALDVA